MKSGDEISLKNN